jgi:hypothetical protein
MPKSSYGRRKELSGTFSSHMPIISLVADIPHNARGPMNLVLN